MDLPESLLPRDSLRFWFRIPFLLEIEDRTRAFVVNGDERIAVPDFWESHSTGDWLLKFGPDSTLLLRVVHPVESGPSENAFVPAPSDAPREFDVRNATWTLRHGDRVVTQMRGRATSLRSSSGDLLDVSRFPRSWGSQTEESQHLFNGRFELEFLEANTPGIATFTTLPDGRVIGNIRTNTCDYGLLVGIRERGHLHLSRFDGLRAILLDVTIDDENRLHGDFWSGVSSRKTWSATRSHGDTKLDDPFEATRWNDGDALEATEVLSLTGRRKNLRGLLNSRKPTILFLFGTWSPESLDALRLWSSLAARFPGEFQLLGLAFEPTKNIQLELERLREFQMRAELKIPVYLAGAADLEQASASTPFLNGIRTFPTTIFLDRDSNPAAIHTGFAGPATGSAHQELRARYVQLINELRLPRFVH